MVKHSVSSGRDEKQTVEVERVLAERTVDARGCSDEVKESDETEESTRRRWCSNNLIVACLDAGRESSYLARSLDGIGGE